MSSDNFDLQSKDGRIWQNLSASSYLDLSAEAMVAVMESEDRATSDEYSDYTEYGVTVAGPVRSEHRFEAAVFLIRQQRWQMRDLERRVEELEEQADAAAARLLEKDDQQ